MIGISRVAGALGGLQVNLAVRAGGRGAAGVSIRRTHDFIRLRVLIIAAGGVTLVMSIASASRTPRARVVLHELVFAAYSADASGVESQGIVSQRVSLSRWARPACTENDALICLASRRQSHVQLGCPLC